MDRHRRAIWARRGRAALTALAALALLSLLSLERPALAKVFGRDSQLSARGRALVREVHRTTGYLLHDRGPLANPTDRRGWTDRDVRRMHKILTVLPDELRFLQRLEGRQAGADAATGQRGRIRGHFITRDALNQQEQTALREAEARLRGRIGQGGPLTLRLRLRGQLALVRAFSALKMGTTFGNAYRDRPEIRLYNELFRGSSLPGLRGMLAFTTVHEIGHRQLFADAQLREAWKQHYHQGGGQQEYATWCGYAAGSSDEGYGVGIGAFAVAPRLLQQKAPRTYAFFVERFGADAFKALRGGPTERWAIQATYGLGDLIERLARPSR